MWRVFSRSSTTISSSRRARSRSSAARLCPFLRPGLLQGRQRLGEQRLQCRPFQRCHVARSIALEAQEAGHRRQIHRLGQPQLPAQLLQTRVSRPDALQGHTTGTAAAVVAFTAFGQLVQ
jgi:hypothetical protein